MAATTEPRLVVNSSFSRRLLKDSRRRLFFLPVCLAFVSSVFVLLSSTSRLYIQPSQTRLHINPPLEFSTINPPAARQIGINRSLIFQEPVNKHGNIIVARDITTDNIGGDRPESSVPPGNVKVGSVEGHTKNDDVLHDRTLFTENYKEMKRKLKIYAYPHEKDDPFANVLLPVDSAPAGNYASESYFKKALFKSRFLTNDSSEAHLFYLPFSIASLRHDKRVGVGGIQNYVRNYVKNARRSYSFWNRTGGADHFYVACHSVGRSAMEKAVEVKLNAIQVVCSSSYFLSGKMLAFYAGAMNSRVREFLVNTWKNDSDISVHQSRLKTPYSEALLGSKFCIHAKGFEVNTARIGDALYYGCVPVVLADHYDLPYTDIINWRSFSVVLSTDDIPMLKRILEGMVRSGEYLKMQRNVMIVQEHFQWHGVPVDYDAFHMVMYELWLRRSHVRISV